MSEDRLKDMNTNFQRALYFLQSFETWWGYHSISGGRLYGEECRAVALSLAGELKAIEVTEPGFIENAVRKERSQTPTANFLDSLGTWASGTQPAPFGTLEKSRVVLWITLDSVRRSLASRLCLPSDLPDKFTNEEFWYYPDRVRWYPHLPVRLRDEDSSALMREASNSTTYVVIGDIRRSQDLMLHSRSAEDFASAMVEFLNNARSRIDHCGGVFDKFTGDGFIAYFNDFICGKVGRTGKESALEFSNQMLERASVLFKGWSNLVYKLHPKGYGLALGSECGPVTFLDRDSHLIAVGVPIVWAKRLADAGEVGDLVIGNLFHREIRDTGLKFESREVEDKHGGKFIARVTRFDGFWS